MNKTNDRDFADGEAITGEETEIDLDEVNRLLEEEDARTNKDTKKKVEAGDDVAVEEDDGAVDKDKKKAETSEDDEPEGKETARSEADREAIRQRRREEKRTRKNRQRDRSDEKDRTIAFQRRQLSEYEARLDAVENRVGSADMARLEDAIEQAGQRVEQARAAFIESGDDKIKQLEAQEVLYQARSQLDHLNSIKQRVNQSSADRGAQGVRKVDPVIRQHGVAWMKENKWYDSTGKDQDSQIVRTLDAALVQEGWDPRTPEYWEELSARTKRYLPHRMGYNSRKKDSQDEDLDTDGDDDKDEQAEKNEARRKSITSGTGRDNPGGGGKSKTFKISAERVAAMKEAGIWDDPVARAKQIKSYMKYDKDHATS